MSSSEAPGNAMESAAVPSADGGEPPILELRGVHKAFGRQRVLEGVDLTIRAGGTTVIIGPSGCGKSVLLKIIVGLLAPDRGQVRMDGQRIDHIPEKKMTGIRTQFGFLFQLSALFDSMTVEQNICFPLREHSDMKLPQRIERCREVLSMVGLDGIQTKLPSQLSGGQRKRVALARAIALHPRVVLYDEPTTGLDPIRADVINELILKLQRELEITSIVVTHDMASAYKIADRMVMLYDGRLIAEGTPEQIRQSTHPVVHGFVEGRAEEHELASLRVPVNNHVNDHG
ncbi:MAG: ABC transporter ATP-binding protein [Phycisphaerae bacterium]|nr:ABC transporter ATP-binding protein [Phycisphaerae bacterium]